MRQVRVRILLGEREVYSAPLAALKVSASGNSVILAQDSGKTQSPIPAFDRIGWSFSVYGLPPKGQPVTLETSTEQVEGEQESGQAEA